MIQNYWLIYKYKKKKVSKVRSWRNELIWKWVSSINIEYCFSIFPFLTLTLYYNSTAYFLACFTSIINHNSLPLKYNNYTLSIKPFFPTFKSKIESIVKSLLLNKLIVLCYVECLLFLLPWSFYYVIIELTQREMYIFFISNWKQTVITILTKVLNKNHLKQ